MRTQVAIIGAGPSGLLLSQLLNRAGIETAVLERASRERVLGRVRAGVLEWGSVQMLDEAGVGGRMHREGAPHDGVVLSDADRMVRIDLRGLTGRQVMLYGQSEATRDLMEAQDAMGATLIHEVEDVAIGGAESASPCVECTVRGERMRIDCDYVAGCDGFHGVSRRTIPAARRREFERVWPFAWLGVLSQTPPLHRELIYANSPSGFALASMRSDSISRCYVQVPDSDRPEDWSDARFWERFCACMPSSVAEGFAAGPTLEKSTAALRSFVSEPMRWGRLFLVGDAAHIVPPTGAKGLNLAISDVFYLHQALADACRGDETGIDAYSGRALARVWKVMRFSWQMTSMLHRFEGEDSFAAEMRRASLAHLAESETARREIAENYVGLPY